MSHIPKYQTKLAAGLDLCTATDIVLCPLCRVIVDTGVYLKDIVPDEMIWYPKMYRPLEIVPFAMVCSRSGLADREGVIVLNAPGIIDCDYEDTIKVILYNADHTRTVRISQGDRIAQLIFADAYRKEELVKDEQRTGGLGSTGTGEPLSGSTGTGDKP